MADRDRFLIPTTQAVACGNGVPGTAVQVAPGGVPVVACWLRGLECTQSAGAPGTVVVRFYRDAATTRPCSRVDLAFTELNDPVAVSSPIDIPLSSGMWMTGQAATAGVAIQVTPYLLPGEPVPWTGAV